MSRRPFCGAKTRLYSLEVHLPQRRRHKACDGLLDLLLAEGQEALGGCVTDEDEVDPPGIAHLLGEPVGIQGVESDPFMRGLEKSPSFTWDRTDPPLWLIPWVSEPKTSSPRWWASW